MPTYEYKCRKCGNEFEAFQKITARPAAKCPRCGGRAQRQMSVGAGLVFKGSGFYLTDYGRSGQKPRSSENEGAASSEKSGGEKSGGEGGDKPGSGRSDGTKAGGEKSATSSTPSTSKPKSNKKKDA